jgi:outer membrane protein
VVGRDLEVSTLDAEIAAELFVGQLNALIVQIAEAYYDLLLARQDLQIQEQARARAVKQYEDTRHDIEQGVLAGQEIYVVEENVVRFRISKESAQRDIAFNEMLLGGLLNLDVTQDVDIETTQTMKRDLEGVTGFADSRARLLESNPDLRIRRLALDRSRIDQVFFQNQVLPILDLIASQQINSGVVGARDDQSTLGFRFEIPLDRSPNRARAQRASMEVQQQSVSIEQRDVELSYQLKRLDLDLATQARILKLREQATQLSLQKLQAEMDKYRSGLSPLVDVVRFQQDVQSSMIQEIRSVVTLNKLLISKGALEGRLYRSFAISIEGLP